MPAIAVVQNEQLGLHNVKPIFTFAAPTKCGNTWFLRAYWRYARMRHALSEPIEFELHRKAAALIHDHGRLDGVPAITVIRHPADWLASMYDTFWRDQVIGLRYPDMDGLSKLQRSTFAAFAGDYLRRCPGTIKRIFDRYRQTSDHICNLDTLTQQLSGLMPRLGAPEFGAMLADFPVQNRREVRSEVPAELRKALEESER